MSTIPKYTLKFLKDDIVNHKQIIIIIIIIIITT